MTPQVHASVASASGAAGLRDLLGADRYRIRDPKAAGTIARRHEEDDRTEPQNHRGHEVVDAVFH